MKLFALTPAVLGMALAATPALAQIADKSERQRVTNISVDDLDLATPQGQKELNWRMNRAVRDVCQTGRHAIGTRVMSHDARGCIAQARASVQAQVALKMAEQTRKGG